MGPNSPKCKTVTEELEQFKEDCATAQQNNAKLHEEEFIRYDSVSLKYMKLVPKKELGGDTFQFELTMEPALGGLGQ
jgi:hypothetical protein